MREILFVVSFVRFVVSWPRRVLRTEPSCFRYVRGSLPRIAQNAAHQFVQLACFEPAGLGAKFIPGVAPVRIAC